MLLPAQTFKGLCASYDSGNIRKTLASTGFLTNGSLILKLPPKEIARLLKYKSLPKEDKLPNRDQVLGKTMIEKTLTRMTRHSRLARLSPCDRTIKVDWQREPATTLKAPCMCGDNSHDVYVQAIWCHYANYIFRDLEWYAVDHGNYGRIGAVVGYQGDERVALVGGCYPS